MNDPIRTGKTRREAGGFASLLIALVAILAVVLLATSYFDTSNSPSRMSEAPSGSAPAPK